MVLTNSDGLVGLCFSTSGCSKNLLACALSDGKSDRFSRRISCDSRFSFCSGIICSMRWWRSSSTSLIESPTSLPSVSGPHVVGFFHSPNAFSCPNVSPGNFSL
jgi:hypothetical protein